MTIQFFENQDKSVLITCGDGNSRRRKTFSHVSFCGLVNLATKHSLSVRKKAWLAFKLERVRGIYGIGDAIENRPADSAVANAIEDIHKSIKRIADFQTNYPNQFNKARDAMAKAADGWAKNQNLDDLPNMGFPATKVTVNNATTDIWDYGTYHFITQWLRDARLMSNFALCAKKQLEQRGWKSSDLMNGPSKEALLYGFQLPKLYERLSGLSFGISKTGDKVKRVTGVAFVLDCAEAMGLPSREGETVASHWKNIKKLTESKG